MTTIKITLEDLFDLPTAELINPDGYKAVTSVSTDTRNIKKASMFVALKGKNFDGHNFINDAVKKGASAVVVNKSALKKIGDINVPVIAVKDTTIALGNIAKIWRNKYEGVVIGITGSNGKTTTKEILYTLLGKKYKVQKTVSNNNNNIGVPLTILSATNKYDALVLELGTNHFGEIPYTADIAEPDFALITNVGDSHLEFLKNKEGVYKEKSAIFTAAAKRGGKIFVNADDKIISKKTNKIPGKITYGFGANAAVQGKIKGQTAEGKTVLSVSKGKTKFEVTLPLYGENNAANYLAAVAIALELGVSVSSIKEATEKLKAVSKRLDVKVYKNTMLIDDTYNANPLSMKVGVGLMGGITKYSRKIVMFGDMFELGSDAVKLHEAIAPAIKKNKISEVYTIGKLMKKLDDKLSLQKVTHKHFANRGKLAAFIEKELDTKDAVILVKGSRGMKMEEFVQLIEKRVKK